MFKMQIEGSLAKGIALAFLSICAVPDIRKKEIPLGLVMIGMAGAIGFNLWQIGSGIVSVAEVALSVFPGISFLLLSWCTREKVGYGDGLLLLITGLTVGFYRCFLGLCIGLLFSAAFVSLLLVWHKAGKDSKIPFAPFLVIGLGVGFLI